MADEQHIFELAEGKKACVRPATAADLDALMSFFTHLPENTKHFLRYNVHNHEVALARLHQLDNANHWRLVAECDGVIVGDGTLDREPYGWTRHIGELRVILNDEFEALGLREIMCEELLNIARRSGIERVQSEVLAERTFFIDILEGLGFKREVVREKYAKGVDGKFHDVVIMSNDVEAVWHHLEVHMHDLDHAQFRFSGKY